MAEPIRERGFNDSKALITPVRGTNNRQPGFSRTERHINEAALVEASDEVAFRLVQSQRAKRAVESNHAAKISRPWIFGTPLVSPRGWRAPRMEPFSLQSFLSLHGAREILYKFVSEKRPELEHLLQFCEKVRLYSFLL